MTQEAQETQEAYETAEAKLRSLGAMRANLEQRLVDIQSREWSRDGRGAQTLQRSIQDIDAMSAETHRVIVALRACR